MHHPKVEAWDGYLYIILHGIDFKASEHEFATHDADFFIGPNYLVTVTDGTSRSIPETQGACERNARVMADGPAALAHRIIDTMVDHYRPEVDKLEERIDELETAVFESGETRETNQEILDLKRDVASLRRIILPQAVTRMLPAIVSTFIVITKESALVSMINLRDLMWHAQSLAGLTMRSMEVLTISWIIPSEMAIMNTIPQSPETMAAITINERRLFLQRFRQQLLAGQPSKG